MPVPDFQSLMLPVLRSVADGPLSMVECRAKVAKALDLTDADLAERLPSGRQTTLANRVAWAKVYLERAELVEPVARGVFRLTDRGRSALAEGVQRIDLKYLRRYSELRAWLNEAGPTAADPTTDIVTEEPPGSRTSPPEPTPEERIEAAHATLAQTLQTELLDRVIAGTWEMFEQLVVDLLVAMGYGGGRAEMARAFQRAGDEGLDGVVKEDALGLDVVYVQAKKWGLGRSVGRPEIQAFVGALQGARATKGVFVTTTSFSRPATEFVERVSNRIVLIEGKELARLLIDHNVAVRVSSTYQVKRIDEDYFTS